jgi:hypothetical protein
MFELPKWKVWSYPHAKSKVHFIFLNPKINKLHVGLNLNTSWG